MASVADSGKPPQWRRNGGSFVSSVERMILDKNYHELRQMAQDALEDGILIGCSETQMREMFHRLIDALIQPCGERDLPGERVSTAPKIAAS